MWKKHTLQHHVTSLRGNAWAHNKFIGMWKTLGLQHHFTSLRGKAWAHDNSLLACGKNVRYSIMSLV
jgi:hypothetical protein